MYKQHQVVLVATDKKSNLHLLNNVLGHTLNQNSNFLCKQQNLYILTEEKIEAGDWYLFFLEDKWELMKCQDAEEAERCNNHPMIKNSCKKIIASTDILRTKEHQVAKYTTSELLPQIHQPFVEYFVTEFNNGNVIDKVNVEYDYKITDLGFHGSTIDDNPTLVINPDNTINIKSIKESWSREEVIELLNKYVKRCQAPMIDTKWIEQNL